MTPLVALIHTSPAMPPVFKPLVDELLGGIRVFHMVDESLLCDIIREKGCPPGTAKRLVGHVLSSEQAGATHIVVTCSSMGRATELARQLCSAEVMRVDEPMADRAIASGRKIGVIATLPSTLKPTAELIAAKAQSAGKSIDLSPRLVEGAFEALMSGRGPEHDALVSREIESLAGACEVIVLAQASIARVVEALPPEKRRIPILSSPRLAIESLAARLRG